MDLFDAQHEGKRVLRAGEYFGESPAFVDELVKVRQHGRGGDRGQLFCLG